MAVLGWVLFGPRPRVDERTLVVSLVWPALYIAYTFAHGAVTDWYPYPFVDVTVLGYVTVLRNGVGLIVLLLGVGSVFRWLDQHLPHSTDARAGAECQLDGPSREELAGSTRTTPRKP